MMTFGVLQKSFKVQDSNLSGLNLALRKAVIAL